MHLVCRSPCCQVVLVKQYEAYTRGTAGHYCKVYTALCVLRVYCVCVCVLGHSIILQVQAHARGYTLT
jgi:hypothetical protein